MIVCWPGMEGMQQRGSASTIVHVQGRTWNLREPMSGLTHFIGIILSLSAMVILMASAMNPLRPWHLAGFLVYSVSAVLLYTASTLYHWIDASHETINTLRKIDHIMIFMFIAATYTPFCLVPFRGPFGWTMLVSIWSLAVLGSVVKVFWIHMPKALCVSLYLGAGFLCLTGVDRILEVLSVQAVLWLASGGLFYCIGAAFYMLDTNDDPRALFGYHDAFHIMVLAGSASHFWVIYRYVNSFS